VASLLHFYSDENDSGGHMESGFLKASEISPGLSQEEEHQAQLDYLYGIIAMKDAALETQPTSGPMKAEEMQEKQALLEIISDLQEGLKLCLSKIEKQGATIDDLKREASSATEAIIEIREHFPALIAGIKSEVKTSQENIGILFSLVAKLKAKNTPQPMQKDRGLVLIALLAANGGKLPAQDARKTMHMSKQAFSNLLEVLPEIETKPMKTDARRRLLILK
jgi:hypothetical protein